MSRAITGCQASIAAVGSVNVRSTASCRPKLCAELERDGSLDEALANAADLTTDALARAWPASSRARACWSPGRARSTRCGFKTGTGFPGAKLSEILPLRSRRSLRSG